MLSFGVSDEAFVLGSARFNKYGPAPLYFGIVAATFYVAWIFSSYMGAFIGGQVDPSKRGLDLAFPVTFVTLLIPALKGKPMIATALAAILIAAGLEYMLPGNELTIILTGALSPLVGLYVARGYQDGRSYYWVGGASLFHRIGFEQKELPCTCYTRQKGAITNGGKSKRRHSGSLR